MEHKRSIVSPRSNTWSQFSRAPTEAAKKFIVAYKINLWLGLRSVSAISINTIRLVATPTHERASFLTAGLGILRQ